MIRRLLPPLLAALTLAPALLGCEGVQLEQGDARPPASGDPRAATPLDNPEGTKPGLAPLATDAERADGLAVIRQLSVKGRGPRTGYDREDFGYAWMDTADGVPLAQNDCDTRNDLLARDGRDIAYRSGSECVVESMTLHDPYTGTVMDFRKADPMEVQVDHVVPLSYAWQLGAARWPEDRREQFANDPLNLLPVDGGTNSAKQDSGPAAWLPPHKRIRCAYAVRFAQVAAEYEMPVTAPDKRTMLRQCGG